MPDEPTPRRGRPPKGAAQLSRDAIVLATLQVVDADGIAAVTMRAVARVLGVDAKSLYNHVDGKEGLLDAVAEKLLGSIELPASTGDLRGDLHGIADAFRDRALEHPEAASLVLTRQLSSFEGLAPIESVLGVLRRAGFEPGEAVSLLRVFIATVIGTLLREVSAGPTYGTADTEGIARRADALRDSGLPSVVEAADHLARFDARAEYAYALDLALDVVEVRLERARRRPPPSEG